MPPTIPPADRDSELNRVLAEYLKAVDQGHAPPPAIWLDANSQLRPELDEFLNAYETVDSVLQPLRGPRCDHRFDALHFANHELLDDIGIGGMSVVYKARQTHPPRIVALKMMSAGRFATALERQRFRTEIEAVSRLDHPHIVSVFEVGDSEGRLFFTMKYCNGGNLERRLNALRADPKAVARMLADLARAVHHAHQHGVLHRDLKPSNVVLDDAGVPFLTDFGLARLAEGTDLTKTGELVGTAAYMAPEQASGRPHAVTTATDVHGLGAVLYACLTGVPPFRAATYVESLERARSIYPPAPSRLNSIVPADLDAICLKCLNKDPARRYGSAAELADDLDRYLTHRPVKARLTRWPERLLRWARRRPELCGLLLTVMAAVLALSFGFVVHLQRMGEANNKVAEVAAERRLHQDAQMRLYASNTFFASTQLVSHRAAESRSALATLCDPATAPHREFAWRYLWRQTRFHPRQDNWHGHIGRVWAMALSPDGRILASAAADNTIRFWNADTGREIGRADVPHFDVFGLDFSCSGQSVFAYQVGKKSQLIEVFMTGQVRVIANFNGFAAAKLAPGKESIVVQLRDQGDDGQRWRIGRVDITSGKLIETLLIGYCREKAIAAGDDSDWVATFGLPLPASANEPLDEEMARRSLTFVHRQTREIRSITERDAEPFRTLVMAKGGKYVAAASETTVYLYDVASGQLLWQKVVWDNDRDYPWLKIQALEFHRNGNFVVSAGANSHVTALQTRTGAVFFEQFFNNFPTAVLWPPGRSGLFVGAERFPHVCYWTSTAELAKYEKDEVFDLKDEGWSLAVSPNNKWIIVGTDNQSRPSTVSWVRAALTKNTNPGAMPPKVVHPTLKSHAALAAAVATVPSTGRVYSASFDNSVAAWGIDTRNRLWIQSIPNAHNLRSIAASPDGRWLAAGDRAGKIHLMDIPTQTLRGELDGHGSQMIRALHFVNNGTVLASGGHDGQVLLWDMNSRGSTLLANVGSKVHCLVASPNGRVLTAATESGQLISWDLNTRKQVGLIYGHDGVAHAVAYSPDGQTLASGGRDRRVHLWQVASGLSLATLEGHTDAVLAVAFTPDGNVLASTGLDKTIRLWRAEKALP